jgi:hypothetical protein
MWSVKKILKYLCQFQEILINLKPYSSKKICLNTLCFTFKKSCLKSEVKNEIPLLSCPPLSLAAQAEEGLGGRG